MTPLLYGERPPQMRYGGWWPRARIQPRCSRIVAFHFRVTSRASFSDIPIICIVVAEKKGSTTPKVVGLIAEKTGASCPNRETGSASALSIMLC